MATRITCRVCGFHQVYRSVALSEYHFPKHSCTLEKKRQARRRRVVQRKHNRVGGIKRGCEHKIARHQHGTRTAYVLDRCRCLPCLDATVAYERVRSRAHKEGRWTHRVDAAPVRERLLDLQAMGCGYKQVCRDTGLAMSTVGTIIYGKNTRRNGAPPKTVDSEIAEKIMGYAPDPLAFTKGARIDSTGTRRRIEALTAAGWTQRTLSQRMGMHDSNFAKLRTQRWVSAGNARKVRDLYEQLWRGPGEPRTKIERYQLTMARTMAEREGWLPPLAWPDDAIDDPDFDPAAEDEPGFDEIAIDLACEGQRVSLTLPERREATKRMAERGLVDSEIARRLGISKDAVCADRTRLGIAPGVPRIRRVA